jgi:hypothetical protein
VILKSPNPPYASGPQFTQRTLVVTHKSGEHEQNVELRSSAHNARFVMLSLSDRKRDEGDANAAAGYILRSEGFVRRHDKCAADWVYAQGGMPVPLLERCGAPVQVP